MCEPMCDSTCEPIVTRFLLLKLLLLDFYFRAILHYTMSEPMCDSTWDLFYTILCVDYLLFELLDVCGHTRD